MSHFIPCDSPNCPNPAHFFWTVESVYCKEHLEQFRESRERIAELIAKAEAEPPRADLNSLARCLKRFGW